MGFLKKLKKIEQSLDRIQLKMEKIVMSTQQFKDAMAEIDAETTRIATKITELLEKLASGGMTAAEEAEAFAAIRAHAERLKLIGHDPTNPVPTP